MTDNEIIKALEICSDETIEDGHCKSCPCKDACYGEEGIHALEKAALDLIQRQQAEIDELTDRTAIRAIDKIHYNIAELNLIKAGFDIAEIKRRFRAEFEENMELGVDDCINWADWLDSIVSELLEETKEGASNDR